MSRVYHNHLLKPLIPFLVLALKTMTCAMALLVPTLSILSPNVSEIESQLDWNSGTL